jgi:transcriptional regulator with XRE-family HTH domain
MSQFPETLKTWRNARRLSQLDLAVEADVSARHISFLETGRARPSREMIGKLGDALRLPLATRNQMLTHAGFAPRYPARRWEAEEMAPIRAAIAHTLSAHAPYPAIAIDKLWTVLRMNGPAVSLFGMLGISEGVSLIDLIVSDRLVPFIENWPDVARHSAQRLRTESAAQGGVAALDRAAEKLANVPQFGEHKLGPVVPTIYRAGAVRLSLFATVAQFGTPEDLALDDLKLELFFPADAETEAYLRTERPRSDQPAPT